VCVVGHLESGVGRDYAKLTLSTASMRQQVHGKLRANESDSTFFHSPKQLQADIQHERVNRSAGLHHRMERL